MRWIKSYPGTVVLVSHDEELLACVDRVVELRGCKLHNFKGDYARFLREREARRAGESERTRRDVDREVRTVMSSMNQCVAVFYMRALTRLRSRCI